ncbi:MAG: hypothetical protein ABIH28_01850 [archaeon]
MNFIKKVSEKKFDESVHLQFQKFSKGEFKNKAVIHAKISGGKYTINTSSEFANEFVKDIAEKIGSTKVKITGAIVSTQDLKKDIEFKEIKQFQGVKKYLMEEEMSGSEILNLIKKFPKNFFALSFSTSDGTILKIKAKAPKSGKPGSKEGEIPKPDFCKLITNDSSLAKSFVFEKPDFKQAEIVHTFLIKEIIIPNELKGEKDFAKVREGALRKGVIVRQAKVDGNDIKTELEFEA